ncbi:unnamed protein product, partial [marine sediment metagenome]
GPKISTGEPSILMVQQELSISVKVTVEYDGNCNIVSVADPANDILRAFGPTTAVNNLEITCDMFSGAQSIGIIGDPGTCAPVSPTLNVSYTIKKAYRNSINFNAGKLFIRVDWNDPANTMINYVTTETSLGSCVFYIEENFSYPTGGTECIYTALAYPFYDFPPALWCSGGGRTQQQTFITYDCDNAGSGQLEMTPNIIEICLYSDIDSLFDDATLMNCRIEVEPDHPNQK